jgi:hypothetical protein
MISPEQATKSMKEKFVFIELSGVSREYLVGQLQGLQPSAHPVLKKDTVEAVKHALLGLGAGQLLTWRCRDCDFNENEFPARWGAKQGGDSSQYPYPSDGYFREVSKGLIAGHGPVVRVTDCGSLTAVRWRFTYKDGHKVVVGNPGWPVQSMKVDVDFFPGMVGPEGKTFANVFFTAAGLNTSGLDIFGMPDGAIYNVRNGELVEQ